MKKALCYSGRHHSSEFNVLKLRQYSDEMEIVTEIKGRTFGFFCIYRVDMA